MTSFRDHWSKEKIVHRLLGGADILYAVCTSFFVAAPVSEKWTARLSDHHRISALALCCVKCYLLLNFEVANCKIKLNK